MQESEAACQEVTPQDNWDASLVGEGGVLNEIKSEEFRKLHCKEGYISLTT